MSSKNALKMRHLTGIKDSPMTHDGPSALPGDDEPFQGRGMPPMTEQSKFALETFLWAPWNKSKTEAPSPSTTIVSLLWTFIMCLLYGCVFLLFNDQLLLAAAPATDIFVQSLYLGIVSAAMYWFTMSMSWHPLLKTQVNFGAIFALVGTFDLGILTFFLVGLFMMTGYAAGGAVAAALGLVSLGNTPTIMPPAVTTAGLVMYWFAGMMIILAYIFFQKFAQKSKTNNLKDPEARYERDQKAILVSAFGIFTFTVAFRSLGLYFFDGGLYVAAWAAAPTLADSIANGVVDWAFYTFIPLTQGAGAILLYYLLMLGMWGSNQYTKEKTEGVSARYRSSYNKY